MRAHLLLIMVVLAGCTGDVAHGSSTTGKASEDIAATGISSTGMPSTESMELPDTGTSMTDTSGGSSTTSAEMFDYEGEHLVVIAEPGLEMCGGTLKHMDEFIAGAADRFEVAVPTGAERIRYTWTGAQDRLDELCSPQVGLVGCARERQVYSLRAPHNHELFHVISYDVRVVAPFFSEGAAVAHQGYSGRIFRDYTPLGVEVGDLLELSTMALGNTSGGYTLAGQFTGYLIGRHGMDDYLRLYAALPSAPVVEEIDQAFQDVLNTSLADSIADYTNGDPMWRSCHIDALLSECNAPEIAWDGELLEMEGEVDCARDDAIGPYAGPFGGWVEVQYTFQVTHGGLYELRLAGDDQESTIIPDIDVNFGVPSTAVSIYPCGFCSVGFLETQVGGTPRWGGLSPGRHTLRLHAPVDEPGPIAFTLKRLPPDPEDVIKDKP